MYPRASLPMDLIAKRYADGRSAQALAREFSVSDATIRSRLKANGVTLRSLSQAQSLWQPGRTKSAIHRARIAAAKKGKPSPKPPGFGEYLRRRMLGRVGPAHPSWRGGSVPLRNVLVRWSEYKRWRSAVFERDDYRCRECGRRGGYKQAHHVKPVAEILRERSIDTHAEALACPALWEVANGLTVCPKCHPVVEARRYADCKSNLT